MTYTLTVNGIEDTAGNTIAPNSQTTFSLVPYVPSDVGGPGISGSVVLSAGTYTLTSDDTAAHQRVAEEVSRYGGRDHGVVPLTVVTEIRGR